MSAGDFRRGVNTAIIYHQYSKSQIGLKGLLDDGGNRRPNSPFLVESRDDQIQLDLCCHDIRQGSVVRSDGV
jgi:hypothetical protein